MDNRTIRLSDAIKVVQDNLAFSVKADIIKALSALPAVVGWLDIESAPRHVIILIYADGPDGYKVSDAIWNNGIWASASLGMEDVVTHWQPLPAPPIE